MDVDHFSRYFNDCGTVYVEGRVFPVDVYHSVKPQEDYQFSCLVTIFKIHREAPPEYVGLLEYFLRSLLGLGFCFWNDG